jgi:hypothetical protein
MFYMPPRWIATTIAEGLFDRTAEQAIWTHCDIPMTGLPTRFAPNKNMGEWR